MEVLELVIWIILSLILYKIIDYFYRFSYVKNHKDKYVLITGCDSGFGRAAALNLDKKGLNVFAGCYTNDGTAELTQLVSSRCVVFQLDISKPESVNQAVKMIEEQIPDGEGLWGLINNAGCAGKMGPPEWCCVDDYRQTLDVNLFGTIDMTMKFLPLVKKARGRIINTTSIMTVLMDPISTPYGVSKWGIECFSDALRRQLKMFDVTVHVILPAGHSTKISDLSLTTANLQHAWDHCPKLIKQQYGEQYIRQYKEIMLQLANNQFVLSQKLDGVVNAYEHALLACRPRARYFVGISCWLFAWPVSKLPEWLADRILLSCNPFSQVKPQYITDKKIL